MLRENEEMILWLVFGTSSNEKVVKVKAMTVSVEWCVYGQIKECLLESCMRDVLFVYSLLCDFL